MRIDDLTLADAARGLREKSFSAVELTSASLARIDETQSLNAFITIDRDGALRSAQAADQLLKAGDAPLLTGIPVAVKDVLLVRDLPATAASNILRHYTAAFDATAVARLRESGAVIVGKTNCDEFAMGASGENSAYGPTRNPWDRARVPGGSSSGSAAAVASGAVLGALGTDTGGSIRQPASFCGIVGFKPTYGRVSRYGLIALASSLDTVGTFARTLEDTIVLFSAIAGHDPRDATSSPTPVPSLDMIPAMHDLTGLRVGVPREYFSDGIDPAVERCVRDALKTMESLGATLVEVSIPSQDVSLPVYYVLMTAEASANLARYDGLRFAAGPEPKDRDDLLASYVTTRTSGFGAEPKRRLMLGTYILSHGYYDAYYRKAQHARTLIQRDFARAFEGVDVLAAPVAPTVAFKLGERAADPLTMYLSDILVTSASIAGIPAISVPCGFAHDLPVGLQFMAPQLGEAALFRAASVYQSATDAHRRRPAVVAK